eukprot:2754822-Prymnesium_polylepis.2
MACFSCGVLVCTLGLYVLSTSREPGVKPFYQSGDLLVESSSPGASRANSSRVSRAASERFSQLSDEADDREAARRPPGATVAPA